MIKPLNTLRFVFMMMIFLHHIDLYPGGGSLAVSAFFILSGFCLSLGYGEKTIQEDFDYIGYLKKRLAKFYPIHWIYLAVFVVLGLLLNPCFQIPLRPLSANVLLMQSWVPEQDYYFSFNAVSWYLCDAVFLAFIFPLLFPAINKLFNQQKWMLLGLMLALYVLMVVFIPGGPLRKSLLYINPLGRCFDFVLGILIYHLLMFLKQKPLRINNRGGVFVRFANNSITHYSCWCQFHQQEAYYSNRLLVANSHNGFVCSIERCLPHQFTTRQNNASSYQPMVVTMCYVIFSGAFYCGFVLARDLLL